jgi:hypothetical protein
MEGSVFNRGRMCVRCASDERMSPKKEVLGGDVPKDYCLPRDGFTLGSLLFLLISGIGISFMGVATPC